MMNKTKFAELKSIALGMLTAYLFQLFFLLMVWLSNRDHQFISGDFIPVLSFQLTVAPMVAWVLMGVLGVRWQRLWVSATLKGCALFVPFTMISIISVMMKPELWHDQVFWVANVALSIILAVTVFRPLLVFKVPKNNKGEKK